MLTPTSNNSSTSTVDSPNANLGYPYASTTLPPERLELARATLAQLRDVLPPMHNLTPKARQRVPKLGMRTRGFVDAALNAARADVGLLPQSIALSDFVAQDDLLRGLGLVQTQVADIKSRLDDAVLLVGSHVYSISRTVYALMKTDAAKAKLPAQKALMKQRFTAKKTSQPATVTAIGQ
jgi:hypothetical protein